jgi:hypothetical protein
MDQKSKAISLNLQKVLLLTMSAGVACFVAPHQLAAASPNANANVTFTASGTFASTPVSGADTLLLRGQPFNISVVGNESLRPTQHGQNWANFTNLQMTGTVYSGLLPGEAIPIAATTAAINQTVGPTVDIFQSGFPVTVIGIALNARAYIKLPSGTLSTPLLRPFPSVAIPSDPNLAYIKYFNSTATTVLAIQTGTLVATIPAAASTARAGFALPFGVDAMSSVRPLFGDPDDIMGLTELSALAPRRAERMGSQVMLAVDRQPAKTIRIQFQ